MPDSNEIQMARISKNIHKLLSNHLQKAIELEKSSLSLRIKISSDLKNLMVGLSNADQEKLNHVIVENVQKIFSVAGPVKVSVESGCLGQSGGGVVVSHNGAFAKACVSGTIASGPTGGGIEVGVKY